MTTGLAPTRTISVHLTHTGTISTGLLQGLLQCAKQLHAVWQIRAEETTEFIRTLEIGRADGAITAVWTDASQPQWLERIGRSAFPVVNLLTDLSPAVPSVTSDESAFGRRGAEYLLGRGLRSFAFVGIRALWSEQREAGFAEALRQAGHTYAAPSAEERPLLTRANPPERLEALRRWLAGLGRPLGVLCCNDAAAAIVERVCHAADLRVPEDVQILGIDNDQIHCELAAVPLSSIVQDFHRLGFTAGKLLDGLLHGQPAPTRAILVPPGEVITRRSTDSFAFDNESVSTSLRLIHEYADRGMSVKEILERVPVSRTWLDREFKRLLGRTPSEEIRRIRLDRVEQLLLQTSLPLREIARRCGFSQVQNLSRFFHDRHGISPREFRARQIGLGPSPMQPPQSV